MCDRVYCPGTVLCVAEYTVQVLSCVWQSILPRYCHVCEYTAQVLSCVCQGILSRYCPVCDEVHCPGTVMCVTEYTAQLLSCV